MNFVVDISFATVHVLELEITKMKRISIKLAILIVLLISLFALAGCAIYQAQIEPSPFPTRLPPQTPSAAVAAAIKDSVFGNPSCALPCWNGITPGITTRSDALKILRDSPFIQETSLQSRNLVADSGAVIWDWKASHNFEEGYQGLSWNAGIVDDITLFPPNISVEEMINRYGPPEKVGIANIGTPEDVENAISLYYAYRGFEIQVNDIYGYRDAQLKPSDLITYVSLFEPKTIEEYLSSLGWQDVSNLNLPDWRGYGNLDDVYGPP